VFSCDLERASDLGGKGDFVVIFSKSIGVHAAIVHESFIKELRSYSKGYSKHSWE